MSNIKLRITNYELRIGGIVFFLLMSFCAHSQVAPLTIKTPIVHFGKIRQGRSLRSVVRCYNNSENAVNLRIKHIGVLDKGFEYSIDPRVLNAHDSGSVFVVLNAGPASGFLKDSFVIEVLSQTGETLQKLGISTDVTVFSAPGKRGPMLMLENNTCDLGKVSFGSKQSCTFTLRNTGDEPMEISVETDTDSWMATDSLQITYPKQSIAAGNSAKITATFVAHGYATEKKYLLLKCNMPDNPGYIYLIIKTTFQAKDY